MGSKRELLCPLRPSSKTLKQETVGIIGVGELGMRVANLFTALGSKVLLAERSSSTSIREGRTAFKDTLSRSTVLVIAASLTPESKSLISAPELALLPSDAVVINVSRGEILNELALITALKEGRIAGGATDVFDKEPASKENCLLLREVENLDGKLIVSPHVAWYASASTEKLRRVTAENIEQWARGEKGSKLHLLG